MDIFLEHQATQTKMLAGKERMESMVLGQTNVGTSQSRTYRLGNELSMMSEADFRYHVRDGSSSSIAKPAYSDKAVE
jgi:TnpA family transposase